MADSCGLRGAVMAAMGGLRGASGASDSTAWRAGASPNGTMGTGCAVGPPPPWPWPSPAQPVVPLAPF